jgi:hypothetical protein
LETEVFPLSTLEEIFQQALRDTWKDTSRYGSHRHQNGAEPMALFPDADPFLEPSFPTEDPPPETEIGVEAPSRP